MMATTEPENIPQTIRSRCQHFSFHAVKFDDILAQLKMIAAEEKVAPKTMRWRCWPRPATDRCATRSPSWTRRLRRRRNLKDGKARAFGGADSRADGRGAEHGL
jgi:replication-associated recombination protein RarA